MDYEVHRFTRRCAISGRELLAGEEYFSALVVEGAEVRRLDYAVEAWQGPPECSLGWWKSHVPAPDAKRPRLAPNDVLMELFVGLEGVAEKADMRLVMALLLVRRRVLKLEKQETDPSGQEMLVLFSPRDEQTYHVTGSMPDAARAQEIQDELSRLLYAGAE